MAAVEYARIGKSYGTVEVMRDLDLVVPDGSFVVLLGPSGCGKTTLLRMTAGLESVTRGDLKIGGVRVNDMAPRDRNIAMVFQNYALYPTMKVRDNIGFSLEVAGLSKAQIAAKVAEAAETLNLTPYLDRYPRELSGGQRQRVAMGRAMVRDAAVFLFDEPLSNLDAKLRAHMRVEIRQLHDRLGATTIYVTHDQIEAMTMADQIVLLSAGKIAQMGPPEALYDRPASRYVADFIGAPAMNFLEGVVEAGGAGPVFAAPGVAIALPGDTPARPGTRVFCGLRPADLVVSPQGAIAGTLLLAETTGADVQLHVTAAGRDIVAVAPRGGAWTPGAPVRLGIDPARVHLFDSATELRIG